MNSRNYSPQYEPGHWEQNMSSQMRLRIREIRLQRNRGFGMPADTQLIASLIHLLDTADALVVGLRAPILAAEPAAEVPALETVQPEVGKAVDEPVPQQPAPKPKPKATQPKPPAKGNKPVVGNKRK